MISGDGSKNLKQHPDSLPANGASQRDGPRHRLLQALLLRGDHHCQSDRHACPHNNVGCSFANMQQKDHLFIVTRFINVSMSLPKTSYVKMVDVWLLFTLLIPFLEVGQISNIIFSCKKSWIQVTNIRSRCSSKHTSSTYGVNLKTRKR